MQDGRFIGTVKPCPECNKREIHIFHVDKEILFDIDLPKEHDVFDANFHVCMCKNCLHLFQFS